MSDETEVIAPATIRVNYWAAARAAAGAAGDDLTVDSAVTLSAVRAAAIGLHPDTGLAAVLAVCSVLVGDQPVSTSDPSEVVIEPGSTVEFLPPFAGG